MKQMTKLDVWFRDFKEADRIAAIQRTFREVFTTPSGAIVLSAILEDLHFFHPPKNQEESALRDYATTLLKDRMGLTADSLAVTTAILNIGAKENIDA